MIHELVINGAPTGKRRDFDAPPEDFSSHPTKSGWGWLPVIVEDDPVGPNEILMPPQKVVEAGQVVDRRAARPKTAEELAAEARAKRDIYVELDALKDRVANLERGR